MSVSTPSSSTRRRRQAAHRLAHIRSRIQGVDHLCSGTLLRRMKRCGKPTCACAHDASRRHGPYYEWGVMHEGRLLHFMVSATQAQFLRRAIANYRRVLRLLRDWEAQSMRVADLQPHRKR